MGNKTERILQWNCRGYRINKTFLDVLIDTYHPSIICLQETNIPESLSDEMSKSDSYRGYKKYFSNYHNGDPYNESHHGVAIFVDTNFYPVSDTININFHAKSFQYLAVTVSKSNKTLSFCSFYRPPSGHLILQELNTLAFRLPKSTILMGDFNAKSLLWGNTVSNKSGDTMETFLQQSTYTLFNDKTHTYIHPGYNTPSSLDLTLASPNLFLDYSWKVLDDLHGSDHFPILLSSVQYSAPDYIPKLKLSKANWESFQSKCINTIDVNPESSDAMESFTNQLITIMEDSIPKTSIKTKHPKPWFTPEVRETCQKGKALQRRCRRHPSEQNKQLLRIWRAKTRRVVRQNKRKSWRKYVSNLTTRVKAKRVWEMVKKISGKNSKQSIDHMVSSDGHKITDQNKIANHLGQGFSLKSSSQNYHPDFQKIKAEQEKVKINFSSNNSEIYNKYFKLRDLKRAIKKAKNTAPGPDNIPYEVLRHLPEQTLLLWLEIINSMWKMGFFPECWQESYILPFPKPNKDKKIRDNYRPISLTSCLCKTVERMVNERLVWYLEKHKKLDSVQCGFRKHHNTLDHLLRLETYIRKAFVKGEQAVAIFFDLERAYDSTWKYGIKKDLHELGLRGRLPTFISNFMESRTFKVRLGSVFSKSFDQEEGVPQGSILAVTVFIVKINNLSKQVKVEFLCSLFVDDFSMCFKGSVLSFIVRQLQMAIDKVQLWALQNGFTFSMDKTCIIRFFPRQSKKYNPTKEATLLLNGQPIKNVEKAKFLGLTFDQKLTFKPHIQNLKEKCSKALNLLKVVSHQNWGADRDTIMKLYRSLVRSKIDYGSIVYGATWKSYTQILEPIQNSALRLALGAFKSTYIPSLNAEANEPPLYIRRVKLGLQYIVKLKAFPQNPAYKSVFGDNLPELFRNKNKIIEPFYLRMQRHIHLANIPMDHIMKFSNFQLPAWELPEILVDTSLSAYPKGEYSPAIIQSKFFERINNYYLNSVKLYTDGSKNADGVGCAVASEHENTMSLRLHNDCNIYSAELLAIKLALSIAAMNPNREFTIISDSLSSLQAIENVVTDHPILLEIYKQLIKIDRNNSHVYFLWVPSHVGIPGNEMADAGAQEASRSGSPTLVPSSDLKSRIKKYCQEMFQQFWDSSQHKLYEIDPVLSDIKRHNFKCRKDETRYHRVRLGHTHLTHSFMFNDNIPPVCEHCHVILSVKHILLECQHFRDEREHYLGNIETLNDIFKLSDPYRVLNFLHAADVYQFI